MELTKLEVAIALSAFIQGLDEEELDKGNDLLKQVESELDNIVSNSTLNQMKEAGESVVTKFIHKILEDE
ncbi:hypothetical protein JC777_00355 (plasmid) [Bacillus cytotoxicus]|uniref:Phage protein n=1 Tax=Bacillus cytotoxicus TaxID=580165 RepID=A0AAX2CK60_9BACI|nr:MULTISPECIES: hypothetical protein [Bacillus cereus group]MDH2882491.1 hypothetical protein [Bacillus cytotoxicus]QTR81171.1 hypothetical protein JC777_00355 [Bacillus cytotoxicus]QTR87945.1 hypothetical protein JC774_05340 [Bacillus cytotoxicus]SCM00471.1 Uncharacterized protein BCB44BAC_03322 [Bacillus cytotoxicus]HDR4573353.1 hypothetical protein [Bacillus cytotoxicus]